MIGKIYYETKDWLVIYKPSGLPTVPLKAKSGGTFLEDVAMVYPEVLSVHGKNPWEGSAIHRLDTPTSGLVLFARNQESYDWLNSEQANSRIIKTYRATFCTSRLIDEGFEPFCFGNIVRDGGKITSRFRSFGVGAKAVRPVLDNPRFQTKAIYTTTVIPETKDSVICKLTKGFRHQIRAHLAWSGHPLLGDTLYGGVSCDHFGLEAIAITFNQKDGDKITISL